MRIVIVSRLLVDGGASESPAVIWPALPAGATSHIIVAATP
jgi:hypothetical protein